MEKTIKFAGENPDDMNYPIGIQTFKDIRTENFAYVDKTALVNSLSMLFKLLGYYVQAERHTSKGRMDITLQTKDYIYILELKVDKSAEEALQQIEDKQYAAPFAADPRILFKIGVCFSSEERGIKEWKINA